MPEDIQQDTQSQENPIYKFMKSNNLTKLDEKAFLDTYSKPEKAKEIHNFMVSNKLTDLDDSNFYDSYLKKKDQGVLPSVSSPTQSLSQSFKPDPSELVSQYKSPDINLAQKPKKDYYNTKLEKGLIFDKEGKLYAPSSEALTKAITPSEDLNLKKSTQKDLVEQSREMPVEEPIEKQGWLLNTVSALDKGFAKGFISSPIKALGTFLQGTTKKVLGGSGRGAASDALIEFGDYLNNAIDEVTYQDEEFKNTLLDQAAQALGQAGSLILTGGIAGAGKGATAALVSQAPKGAALTATKALGSQLSSPTAVSAGLTMGQAEFDRAIQAGANDDQAFEAFYKNAGVGSVLETIPVMQFFKRFNKATAGSVANYIKTKGVAGITGGIEEMTTEIIQQLYSNKTAKDIYNINQSLLEGVGSSGGVGFGVGFLLNAMGANAKILKKQGKVEEASVLENQVKQYEDDLEKSSITQEEFDALKDKPVGTKTIIKTKQIEEPTEEQIIDDVKNKRLTTFTYKSEEEVPEQFKDKISSTGENTLPDGTVEQIVRVTVPQSIADYELAKTEPTEVKETIKTEKNAIQEPSTGEILQRQQEGVGETGGERTRVEPSIEGQIPAQESKQVEVDEKEIITPPINVEKRLFTTSKKNTVDFEDGKLVVRDRKGQALSERASKSSLLEYADNFDFSVGKQVEVPQEIIEPREQARYAIEKTENPLEVASIYFSETPMPIENDKKMQAIAEYGLGRIKTSSYNRFGDSNKIEKSMYLNIFSEQRGRGIDQIAQEISKEGLQIDPEDIVKYIEKYSKGDKRALELQETDLQLLAKDKFKELTGLELTPELSNKILDKELQKANQEQLNILKQDYETAKELEDAYWAEYEKTDGFTKESPVSEVNEPEPTEKEVKSQKVNEFLYTGTEDERQKALLKNLMNSDVPKSYKKGLEELGLNYKVSNSVEASEAAKAIIKSLGVTDALDIARAGKIDASVGSAIYGESLNNIWSNERKLKADGKIDEAKVLAKQWADVSVEYANSLNYGGKMAAQLAYFYKTSPMGFAMRIENEKTEEFEAWYKDKEKDYKKAFAEILKSEEGQSLLKEEVEKISKEEKAKARADKRQKIDEFFENAKLKGNNLYAIPIPPQVINGALEVMKKAVLAGESVTNAVSMAVEHISKEVKDWDKEKFRKEYEEKLNSIVSDKKEKTYDDLLKQKIKNLEEQIKDYEQKIEQGGIESKKRIGKFDNVEAVKKLIEERDKLRKENEKLTRKPSSTKEEAILKRIEKLENELNRVQERRKKERLEKGTTKEKEITEEEKALKEAIYAENEKWDSEIDSARNAANDYRKLETERNRQLKRVGDLKEKLNILEGGNLPASKKREVKLDTPEIELLKAQIKEAEKNVRESISHENKLRKLEKELDRLKNRKRKEKRLDDKIEISDEESDVRRKIEEERLSWKVEDNVIKLNEELQRVKDRKEKITEPREKRQLTAQEEKLVEDIKNEKEKWSKELEPKRKAEKEIQNKKNRIAELNRRIYENDFTAETYKAKREKNELDKELEIVKQTYDEAKEKSPEYIDKKAKQYLDRLRQRLKGVSEEQKEQIIRRSIKEIVNKGGLEYQDFKDIVSETIGVKKLTDEQKSKIESLTEQSNIADDLEQEFLNAPSREGIDAFLKAKAKSLEADKELFDMTSQKADIIGTIKSLITLNYLSLSTIIKNYAQNVIYQATVRFPISLSKKGIDLSVYGATYMGNKMFGTKVIKPGIGLIEAQKIYFKQYNDARISGWRQMNKGVDEKDYFATNQYVSSIRPQKSINDLKASMKGELFLTKKQKIDKWIQGTLGWQANAISRAMIYGDKPPRYAAQAVEAMSIAHNELGIVDPIEVEAFMLSPEKYSYKHLIEKAGLTSEEASKYSQSFKKRIIDAGSEATFQNENAFNDLFSKIDEWAKVKEDDRWQASIIKPPVALLKATQLPYIKTPANVAWAFFKIANPSLTALKSLTEYGLAKNALSKGDYVGYREYSKKSKESFGLFAVGLAITAAAASLVAKGLVRTSIQDDDKAREKAGEGFFGKSNQLNLGALMGGDDYWVDLSWFGPVGTIIDIKGRQMEDNRQKELKGEKIDDTFMSNVTSTMGYSISSTLNTLVFDQGAKIVDAVRSGWGYALDQVIITNTNAFGNVFFGGTLPALNKAMASEKADLAADDILNQIINNQKQRNIFVTWAKGYPPSKVSIWGEPIKQDKSISGVIGTMLGFEKGSADKFGAVLYNEQRRTGINEFFPPVEDKKIKVNGKDVKITAEEKRDLDAFIGQARKPLVSSFINDKSIYTVFLKNGEEVADFTYSDLTKGKNILGQTISQAEADRVKLAALSVIYENGKKAGFSKFKEKYKQYQDAELNVEKIQKQALESAEKTIFKAKIEEEPE